MHSRWLSALLGISFLLPASIALGQGPLELVLPGREIRQMLPEELPELHYPLYYTELEKARDQAFRGRYNAALISLRKVTEGDAEQIAVVRATALRGLGRRADALPVLADPAVAGKPAVEVLKARILAELGRQKDALAALQPVIKAHPKHLPARYLAAKLLEETGNLAEAMVGYRWFDEQKLLQQFMGNLAETTSAEDVVLTGLALDRVYTVDGFYVRDPALRNNVLSLFLKAQDVIDRAYWPAHVAAAEYFMRHDDNNKTQEQLAQALKGNPRDPAALYLAGRLGLARYNFDSTEKAADEIRKADPTSIVADILDARNLLLQRRPADALVPLQRVLDQQPNHLEALGLLAGAYALQLEEDKLAATLKRVEAIDPNNASAYLELAEQLASMRQYPRAAKVYQIAIDRAPWWSAARNGLGLLYTQSGDEDLARTTLESARALDPHNVRTTNYLKLLDMMDKMEREVTENFIVLYDKEQDPIIGKYFAEYMEKVHADLCKAFNHTPGVKTLIEVFPTHSQFSVRTTGSPWIGTVGASTGRVIAMVSPRRGSKTLDVFNWAQVLRHEYAHTVTLSATDNRIAHWMTEGLAVMEEHSPLRWEWVPMLYNAVSKGELFKMSEITWAFVRPKRPSDRSMAYAQSYWVCSYIQEKYGRNTLMKMMDLFRQGKRQEVVFEEALGISESQFDEQFAAWAKKQTDGWGYDAASTAKVRALQGEAENLTRTRKMEEAIAKWQEVEKLRPMDALPPTRLAGLYLATGKTDLAVEKLQRLHSVSLKDNRYAKRIARIYRDANRVDEALTFAQQAIYIDPYDIEAQELRLELKRKANDPEAERQEELVALLRVLEERRKKEKEIPPDPALARPPAGGGVLPE